MAKVTGNKKVKTNNVITPPGIASFCHVWEMAENLNGALVYSLMILFPKETDLSELRAAIQQAAINEFGPDKKKWPKNLRGPIRDGDEKAEETGEDVYRGKYFINPWTKKKPGIVGPDAKPLMDQDEFYSGCWCRASVNFAAYKKGGNTGVGVYLNNLMKIKDGERLDGRKNAEDEFSEFASQTEQSEFEGQPNNEDDIPF